MQRSLGMLDAQPTDMDTVDKEEALMEATGVKLWLPGGGECVGESCVLDTDLAGEGDSSG